MRLLVIAFVAGASALQREARLPEHAWGLAGLAIALAAALVPARLRLARFLLLIAAGLALGFGYAAWRAQTRLAESLPFVLEGRDVVVVGVVEGLPQQTERGVRFTFRVEEGAQIPALVSLSWFAERDAGPASLPRIVPAQRWRFTVRLKRPRGLANPHAFDFEPWALERGLRATGYIRSGGERALLDARVDGWPQTLHRWRHEVRERMRAALGAAPLAGVLVALAIGDQDAIAPGDWDVFWRTGVGHLMSISGLHITMLAALAFALAMVLWVRIPPLAIRWPARKAAAIVALAVALAYTLMSGAAVPAQRTLLMVAVVAMCLLLDRHGSPSRMLALAAGLVVLADPWAVTSPGFWLSFGAVAGILYATAGRVAGMRGWRAALREQLVVTLAMVPLLAALFQELSLVSPLANALAIPLVSLVVVPLTIAGAFFDLAPLLDAAHALMAWLMVPLSALASAAGAMLEVPAPPAWAVVAAVVGCAWTLAPRGVPMRSCGLIWLAPLVLLPAPRPATGEAWLDVLDVGNGLAVVVRTASHALLFDAGPAWQGDADSGERIVVPYLRGEGVALDGMVVSHADDDHAGGAISVAAFREPRWLRASLPPEDALHALVPRSHACAAGDGWDWDGVKFAMLHPQRPRGDGGARKENDWSCVLAIASAGGVRALITGDIEARGERELLAADAAALRAEVLVVPHHGSRTSSTPPFVAAVAPAQVIYTVAYRNRFGHPHPAVVERYAQRGAMAWRSDRDGALRVRLPAQAGRAADVERLVQPMRYWSDRRIPP